MSPSVAPLEGKIVRVRHDASFQRYGLSYLVRDAPALAIGNRRFLAVEVQAQLLAHVPRRSPTHQRLDPAGRLRLKIEHPVLGVSKP